jgi:hypothetical protein
MSRRRPTDTGAVTAETAVVLPALIIVALVLGWAVTVGVIQMRCYDAARGAARAAARGEPIDDVEQIARDAAPAGADVTITRVGDEVTVAVKVTASAPSWFPAVPPMHVAGSAMAIAEDRDHSGWSR